MGRISLMGAGTSGSWTPASLANLAAWWTAEPGFVTLTGSDVDVWSDRSGNGNNVDGAGGGNDPEYQTNGWASGKDAINFAAAEFFSHPSLGSTEVDFSGSDVAFSVLMTVQIDVNADQVLVCWDHTSGTGQSNVRTDNAGTGRLRYQRVDDAGSSATPTGTVDLGTGHRRLGVLFAGTTVDLYVDTTLDVNDGACNVGTATFNRFRIGTGPAIDALDGRFKDIVVVGRAISSDEWTQYYNWSVGEFGA